MRRLSRIAPLLVVAPLLAGCLGNSTNAGMHRHRIIYPTIPTLAPCPSPPSTGSEFPQGESSDVPHPSFATSPKYLPVHVRGVKLLQFQTAMPLRNAVLFVLQHYPSSGYDIGRGDAEAHEADVPFVNGSIHGTTRLSGTGNCTTRWLVATVSRANAPLTSVPQLAPHYTTSPPPFAGG